MQSFIKKYIDKISLHDIIKFGKNNNIFLSDSEASILQNYLKNNWEELLYGDPSPIIKQIEKKFDTSKSDKIIKLFNIYLDKYKNYL